MRTKPGTETPLPQISISLLGGFAMQVGDVTLAENFNRSHKLWTLLAYLIVHRGRGIPQAEFIELLWQGEEDEGNPVSALKALFFRIRRMLASQFGELPFINSLRNSYAWNGAFPCEVDCERFEQLCRSAEEAGRTTEERVALYRQAFSLYKGDFLPKMASQLWAIPFVTYYHNLYMSSVKSCGALLQQLGLHEAVSEICFHAIKLDPYDEEMHILLLQAMLAQGRYAAALTHYEATTELYYRALGIQPSAALQALYLDIMKRQEALETDLGLIQMRLGEEGYVPGAYYCDYGFFKEAYRINARLAGRTGMSIHIVLFTLTTRDGSHPEPALLASGMKQLFADIQTSLRRVDIFTQYSTAQYLLMLPRANYEDSVMVTDRIADIFYRKTRLRKLRLVTKLQQLNLPQPPQETAPKQDADPDEEEAVACNA